MIRIKKFWRKRPQKAAFSDMGIDVAHFPAELATINLYKQNIEDYANFPRVISKDFLRLSLMILLNSLRLNHRVVQIL